MRVDRQEWEKKRPVPTLPPEVPNKRIFMHRALMGRMDPVDQAYMARSILQLSDEAAEMRARIRALEMAVAMLMKPQGPQ
jgi:hypothetical protein